MVGVVEFVVEAVAASEAQVSSVVAAVEEMEKKPLPSVDCSAVAWLHNTPPRSLRLRCWASLPRALGNSTRVGGQSQSSDHRACIGCGTRPRYAD